MKSLSDEFGGDLPNDPAHRLEAPELQKGMPNRAGGKLRLIGLWLDEPVVTSRSRVLAVVCCVLFLFMGRLPHAYESWRMVPLLAMIFLFLRRGVRAL
jgi:hypothetical protein